MFRYLERSENMARLVNAGFRIALTRTSASDDEWVSVLRTIGQEAEYNERYDTIEPSKVIDFLLRDKSNPSSILRLIETARNNGRMVRTALTQEVWEATNECWITLKSLLARPIREKDLPSVLGAIRQQSALVRGALHGTMLRNDTYNFARMGTFIERADNTARILDVKYYVLLPSISYVGSSLDNVQWENILRSVSALRAFGWAYDGDMTAKSIADFLILDRRLPRSLAFCNEQILMNAEQLTEEYGEEQVSLSLAKGQHHRLKSHNIDNIFEEGLHEFLQNFLRENARLALRIEEDYRFYG